MTTYPTSTAPAAKRWLFGRMQAVVTAVSDHTFLLSYAINEDDPDNPDDLVYLSDIANRIPSSFAMVGNLGQYAVQEEYDLTGQITIFRAGADDAATCIDAESRAWAVLGLIETEQRTDPTMGGLLWRSMPNATSSALDWSDNENGRICSLPFSFHCQAVI